MSIRQLLFKTVFTACLCAVAIPASSIPAQAGAPLISQDGAPLIQQAGPQVNANDSSNVIGAVIDYTTKKKESLFDVARKFDIGIIELRAANPGVDPWNPKAGTVLKVGTMHLVPPGVKDGLIVNLAAMRLYYYNGEKVMTFPIAAGREGWETPTAVTKIMSKRKNPTWTPTDNIRAENPDLPDVIPAGKDNPLGQYAMALGVASIMIHGTNSPASIGRRASHGCIRLYPEDIESLFNAVPKGTQVTIADMPYQLGWDVNHTIYIEVAPKLTTVAKLKKTPQRLDAALYRDIQSKIAGDATVDWEAVEEAFHRADGIPVPIGSGNKATPVQQREAAVGHTPLGMN
ncbi:MAG: L,D-transpeptidase family protein [Micavibrio sp.]|nr:L,D-transpeptidase family protein [Micavibrio sp.]